MELEKESGACFCSAVIRGCPKGGTRVWNSHRKNLEYGIIMENRQVCVCVCVFIPTDLKSSVNAGSTGTGRETQRDYETCEIRLNGHDCDSASVPCDIIRETLEAGENVTECRRIFIICTCVWGHVCDLSAAYYSRLNVWINNMETMQCHKVVTFIYVWRPGRLHECESVDFTLKFNTCSKTDKYYIIFDKLKKLKLIITKLLR